MQRNNEDSWKIKKDKEFIDKVNENLGTHFQEKDINVETKWIINNVIWGEKEIDIFIRCLPETQIGAIEKIMLEALATDEIECNLIDASEKFINKMSKEQTRYLQKNLWFAKQYLIHILQLEHLRKSTMTELEYWGHMIGKIT